MAQLRTAVPAREGRSGPARHAPERQGGYRQLENYLIALRVLRATVSLSATSVLLADPANGTAIGLAVQARTLIRGCLPQPTRGQAARLLVAVG